MSEKKWHYMKDGQSMGPVPEDQLIDLLNDGVLTKDTMVWFSGSDGWTALSEALNLEDDVPPPLPIGKQKNAFSKNTIFKFKWSSGTFHPWRRYFARMLDTTVNGMMVFFCISIPLWSMAPKFANSFFNSFDGPEGRVLDVILTTFFAMFLSAALIGYTGSSLGKWFFGLKVVDGAGNALGYKQALKRELAVWVKGFGFGIPLVSFFTVLSAYQRLKADNVTLWDKELGTQVLYRDGKPLQWVLNVLGFIIFAFVLGFSRSQL
ncbi:MAG: RDD family protein [Alphaproteobacteria bacterium]|nr:RDD family protein [Alphaproteobacteria bacterium]